MHIMVTVSDHGNNRNFPRVFQIHLQLFKHSNDSLIGASFLPEVNGSNCYQHVRKQFGN